VAPADAVWDLPSGNASWGARQWAALLGAVAPSFARATAVLQELTPVRLSARALETYTEALGDASTLPVPAPHAPGPPAEVLVIQADAGTVLFRGEGGREVKGYTVYRQVDHTPQPPRYAVVQGAWAQQDAVVLALARREGWRLARTVCCVADGAPGIWCQLSRLFPEAVQVLDWYHLMTHIRGGAALLADHGACWRTAQETALWERGPREILRALLTLLRQDTWDPQEREMSERCVRYNRQRMDYAEARRRGFPRGSGRMESAVKQVQQGRAKGPGMRWVHGHVQAVLNARCAFLSGDWLLACAQVKAAARPLTPPVATAHPRWSPRVERARPADPPVATRRVAVSRPPDLSHREAAAMIKQAVAGL
jgi:hypothetical protein